MTLPIYYRLIAAAIFSVASCSPAVQEEESFAGWPATSIETKPWTRWWWHGSAVTMEGITAELEAYQRAGIGGVEITPIYGVYGEQDQFIQYLSPRWMEMLGHVFSEAARLGMGVDMATGTGWPFGGPWVKYIDACKNIRYTTYDMKRGEQLRQKITMVQPPYLRLIGNNVYKAAADGRTRRVINPEEIRIKDILEPVELNSNLQDLAIDQVQFERPLKLSCLIAYGAGDQVVDLTTRVNADGVLDWTAPEGQWKLYAVFEGFHGKMVERAGPGGEGNVIDHFSMKAVKNYLTHFDEAFGDRDISPLRAFFNDSYEVDDARGASDFTPALFEEFKDRRGYDLKQKLPVLFSDANTEEHRRVLCDYRETLSDLLLESFTQTWKDWAHKHDAVVRNQAHGAPSNILDLYGVVDIPEIEGTEPLRIKMASSSGNVTGKKLVSAEAATWLDEHFLSDLGDVKSALDNFMLHGVNHIVYHGSCYSPPDDQWPGRLFYAAVHLNPRNPQWKDFNVLNEYVTRCQSVLQNSHSDNDVLLYYPIYDRFSAPGDEMIEHFDGIGGFKGSSFESCAELMLQRGFAFDYISDKQITLTSPNNGLLKTPGGRSYKLLVIPECAYIPVSTMEKLLQLAEQGCRILFVGQLPRTHSGYGDRKNNVIRFQKVIERMKEFHHDPKTRALQITGHLAPALMVQGVRREAMTDLGIQCIRKKTVNDEMVYFIRNQNKKPFDGWLPISIDNATAVNIYDPMTGRHGRGKARTVLSRTEVLVQLEPMQSLIVVVNAKSQVPDFVYRNVRNEFTPLKGKWHVRFESGGPVLPPSFVCDSLTWWTNQQDSSYKNFSGTASYALSFPSPADTVKRWLLELDSVQGTAEVILNGKTLGTLIGPTYRIEIDREDMVPGQNNIIRIEVSNLMANRIAYMDRNHIFWKKFCNVNFAARRRENTKYTIFDASHWEPQASGISGTARLFPLD